MKTTYSLILFCILGSSLIAQETFEPEFNASMGFSVGRNTIDTNASNTLTWDFYPRVNLITLNDDLAISVDGLVGYGLTAFEGRSSPTDMVSPDKYQFINYGLLATINFGHAASQYYSKEIGGFFGAGIRGNFTFDQSNSRIPNNLMGLGLQAGARLEMNDKSLSFGGYTTIGKDYNAFGVLVAFNFWMI